MIKKPETFDDLLNLQKRLDENIGVERENNFIPRDRTEIDILLALDDEFQEWLRELPYEYNFKTWKQKEYNRDKELEELTDVLFFFLQYLNENKKEDIITFENEFKNIDCKHKYILNFNDSVSEFKKYLWKYDIEYCFGLYADLITLRGFNKQDILNTYWNKWQKNMKRISEDGL